MSLFVVSGPSGAGKTTLLDMLSKLKPSIHRPISCTTRAPKKGERHGVHYHFVPRSLFERRREVGQFAEWAEVHGELYGTLKIDLAQRVLGSDIDIVLEIDVQGKRQIKASYPDACTIFILPPSFEVLEQRIRYRNRGELENEILRRLNDAKSEIAFAPEFDHQVINTSLKTALRELLGILGILRTTEV